MVREFIPFVNIVCDVLGATIAVALQSAAVVAAGEAMADIALSVEAHQLEGVAVAEVMYAETVATTGTVSAAGLTTKATREETMS